MFVGGLLAIRLPLKGHLGRAALDPLLLRRWALEVLWPGAEAASGSSPPPTADADAWHTFLRAERCGGALAAHLDAADAQLPAKVVDLLRARAAQEARRALSARAQLKQIGHLAEQHDMRVVVLKGGLAAVQMSPPPDLVDLDLLLPAEGVEVFADLLTREGYRSGGSGNGPDHHLPPHALPGHVHVEIHRSLRGVEEERLSRDVMSRLESLDGFPGIQRLAPVDHLWYLLIHSAVVHPDRRGSLRELLLLDHALGACGEEELQIVRERIGQHEAADVLRTWLDMAVRLRAGAALKDPFPEVAAVTYLFVGELFPAGLSRATALALSRLTFHVIGHSNAESPWRHAWADVKSPRSWLAFVDRRAPRLGRIVRPATRLGRLAALYPMARVLAWSAGAAVRRAAVVAERESPARGEL